MGRRKQRRPRKVAEEDSEEEMWICYDVLTLVTDSQFSSYRTSWWVFNRRENSQLTKIQEDRRSQMTIHHRTPRDLSHSTHPTDEGLSNSLLEKNTGRHQELVRKIYLIKQHVFLDDVQFKAPLGGHFT
ncbi:PREDICTED: uncharacterized protein LOC109467861 [Branchiostoma belcheri]|uniref:Uncharacterized protein LOC109467861 n=1 Tax=Branchiostoma belcheri TaxID=7741 RepID=A0A6P4YSA6_BRABE|nr:PREDICTED: uncharacterized protein LOC109467861 [Branchiostoma belcheri]